MLNLNEGISEEYHKLIKEDNNIPSDFSRLLDDGILTDISSDEGINKYALGDVKSPNAHIITYDDDKPFVKFIAIVDPNDDRDLQKAYFIRSLKVLMQFIEEHKSSHVDNKLVDKLLKSTSKKQQLSYINSLSLDDEDKVEITRDIKNGRYSNVKELVTQIYREYEVVGDPFTSIYSEGTNETDQNRLNESISDISDDRKKELNEIAEDIYTYFKDDNSLESLRYFTDYLHDFGFPGNKIDPVEQYYLGYLLLFYKYK